MSKIKVLIVDDSATVRKVITNLLENVSGIEVIGAVECVNAVAGGPRRIARHRNRKPLTTVIPGVDPSVSAGDRRRRYRQAGAEV